MSTGQTMLTLGAFILLSTILVTFYRLLAESGQTIDSSQSSITAVALATSYTQMAQGLAFDEVTIDSFVTRTQINALSSTLGADNQFGQDNPNDNTIPRESSNKPRYFDDFDDFNGQTLRDTTLAGTLGDYAAKFSVYYVNPDNIDLVSMTKTFVKRMDIKIWREFPVTGDTLKTSFVLGYFLFNR